MSAARLNLFGGVWIAILMLVAFFTGCATLAPGPYAGDKFLLASDSAVVSAYASVDAFLKYEQQNRAELLLKHPNVKQTADNFRINFPRWRDSYFAIRDAYAANPTGENHAAVERALNIITSAALEASKYIGPP